jgi:hypothetical protein
MQTIFPLLAHRISREQQAFRISLSDYPGLQQVLFQAIDKNGLLLETSSWGTPRGIPQIEF